MNPTGSKRPDAGAGEFQSPITPPALKIDLKNPSGALMMARGERVRDYVLNVLIDFPPTRGDDLQLWITVLRKYYWRLVKIQTAGGRLAILFSHFQHSFLVPMPETTRRRRQEIQHEERERIWVLVEAKYPGIDRASEQAIKEFEAIAKFSKLLPTGRVQHKRERAELAHEHYYGKGELTLMDY